ncbi:MAG: glutamate-5-semialdehyde dehydrogenase, partial [Aeromicrobium sp.]
MNEHGSTKEQVQAAARRARIAAATLALTPRAGKDAALIALADALLTHTDEILSANALDVAAAREAGI